VTYRQRPRTWLSEAIIIAALMILPLLFWWRLWALEPADRAVIHEGDFASQYYPLQLFAARELADGRLPAWDPYLNAGQPGLADIQTGAFYPPNLVSNLVLAALGIPLGIGLLTAQVVLHFALASLFTYLLMRHLARRAGARLPAARFAGAVAALSFTYAGYLTSFPVQQLTILETAVWLPLVLFFLDRASDHPHPRPQIILAGVALACALLAGHPQTALYVVYVTFAYGLFLVWSGRKDRAAWRTAVRVFVPLILGIALAAIQLVPTLTFIARSTRSSLDYDAVAWGFPLAEMTHLLYPGYFGGSPQYVGILPPILAIVALFLGRARRRVAFWMTVGLVALVLAFGGNTFLFSAAYLLAPGLGAVRNQERVIYLFSLAVSVLAGYGALILVQPLPPEARRGFRRAVRGLAWACVTFVAFTALWTFGFLQGAQQGVEVNLFEGVLRHHTLLLLILGGSWVLFALRSAGRARRTGLIALALGLIWLNLFTINWRYNLADPAAEGPFPETGCVRYLKEQPGTFRISSAGLLPGGSSAGVIYELEDITANTPLRLEAFQHFEDKVGSWQRWQLLNVHYVLSQRDLDGAGMERVYEEEEVKVYRISDPLSRAWVVHSAVIRSDGDALALLSSGELDPRATAVLPPGSQVPTLNTESRPGSAARVVESAPGRLVLDVSPAADGLLVISQPFYPGWRAWVNGERVPVSRVDYLLQGVPVQAGPTRVKLAYHLSPWPAIISLAAVAGCIAGLALKRR
jgi:hypothetical protein